MSKTFDRVLANAAAGKAYACPPAVRRDGYGKITRGRTDGVTVWSYDMPIARKCRGGWVVVFKGPSMTTNSHIRAAAWRFGDRGAKPVLREDTLPPAEWAPTAGTVQHAADALAGFAHAVLQARSAEEHMRIRHEAGRCAARTVNGAHNKLWRAEYAQRDACSRLLALAEHYANAYGSRAPVSALALKQAGDVVAALYGEAPEVQPSHGDPFELSAP
jgi:hypothetical protein